MYNYQVMGILYVVATPIGNMEDITLRAIKVLGEIDYIACEDTRKTGLLLTKLKKIVINQGSGRIPSLSLFRPRLVSYREENETRMVPEIVNILLKGYDVALVSNAGTPSISDPGFKLVEECLRNGIKVVSVPGPSAILAALTSSGLPTDKFLFLGFLPKRQGKRQKVLRDLSLLLHSIRATVVIFEAPHRLLTTMTDLKEIFGDIEIVICRELTKIYEEVWRGKISEAISHFQNPIGEFVIIL